MGVINYHTLYWKADAAVSEACEVLAHARRRYDRTKSKTALAAFHAARLAHEAALADFEAAKAAEAVAARAALRARREALVAPRRALRAAQLSFAF